MPSPTPTASGRVDRATALAFAAVTIFGGINAIAIKETLHELAPLWSAGLRFAMAGLLLVGIVAATGRSMPRGRSLWGAAVYGAVGFAGSYGFAYHGLREVPAGTGILFLSLVPLLTFGLAIVQRQERFRPQGLIGAVLALGGVAVVVADQLGADVPFGSMLLILAAAFFVAESAVILKWVPRSDPFATNAVAMLTGAAHLLGVSAIDGEAWAIPGLATTWLAVAYLVLFGSVALFALYLFALRRLSASAVSYVTLLMPLVTVPLAAVLTDEPVSLSFLAGAGLALLGVYLGAFASLRPRRSTGISLAECPPVTDCVDVPVRRGPAAAS
jgi:drug/metabolite transporter (DMT)-like permease